MQPFKYFIICDKCGETYDPAAEIILGISQEDAVLKVCRKHTHCPKCREPFSQKTEVYLSLPH